MICWQFRRKHDAYVDDTLSGVELDGMVHHLRFCEQCAQLDTRVRRSLLLVHNLPEIHPSPAFTKRLSARLMTERVLAHAARGGGRPYGDEPAPRLVSPGSYAAVAALLLAGAGLAGAATLLDDRDDAIRLSPVVAFRPETEPSPLTTPAMVAVMPAGMPFWPAIFVAQQAPWHFASDVAGH